MLVLTGLTILATTHSFECLDHATGQSTECRLCGDVNPLTGGTFQCNAGKDSFEQSLEGFSSSVVWLIFAAFHLGKAVEMTQLGRRISLLMIKSFGKHVLGLGYAIVLSGKLKALIWYFIVLLFTFLLLRIASCTLCSKQYCSWWRYCFTHCSIHRYYVRFNS